MPKVLYDFSIWLENRNRAGLTSKDTNNADCPSAIIQSVIVSNEGMILFDSHSIQIPGRGKSLPLADYATAGGAIAFLQWKQSDFRPPVL